eukprot:3415131-Amphidinium_carterae.1
MRYLPEVARWLIDRRGLQPDSVCNAFSEQGNPDNPSIGSLVWYVWEAAQRGHVRDPEMFVTDAPAKLQ